MIENCEKRKELLSSTNHLIVLGGPGSGKTTIALLKAKEEIRNLLTDRKILFLSFARATVARVLENISEIIDKNLLRSIEINTYHSFFWNILRSHGYLLNKMYPFKILNPANEAVQMAYVNKKNRKSECEKIFRNNGLLVFDLFAPLTKELLSKSKRLRDIISRSYPIIIVDEFQDTNIKEWEIIKLLGGKSRIIALADPDQRIYDFRGADPARIVQFVKHFNPDTFDFGDQNNRSPGTDINLFGKDILTGKNQDNIYNDVNVIYYPYYGRGFDEMFCLKTNVINGMRRTKNYPNQSIAVLLPTKYQMLQASNYFFSKKDNLPYIDHDVSIDSEGPELAGTLFSKLLEKFDSSEEIKEQIIIHIIDYLKGRKGSTPPSKKDLQLSEALEKYLTNNTIRGKRRLNLIKNVKLISNSISKFEFTGNPLNDWQENLKIFKQYSEEEVLKSIAEDVKYVRLLHKGSFLRESLNRSWRKHSCYYGSSKIFQQAIQRENLSFTVKKIAKVNIMTIHRSKGKQFHEVFLFEGFNRGRFVRSLTDQRSITQSRLALKVAVTRAMNKATILTPKNKRCEIL